MKWKLSKMSNDPDYETCVKLHRELSNVLSNFKFKEDENYYLITSKVIISFAAIILSDSVLAVVPEQRVDFVLHHINALRNYVLDTIKANATPLKN